MSWIAQLVVLKDGQVIDNVPLHGKETFVLGRHQNCDIVAGHASISRHHLELRVRSDSREVLVTDLHSVHGTMINDKLVHAMESAVMNEGDKLRLGGSTRTYIVKWIPVSEDCSESSSSSCTPKSVSSCSKGLEVAFQNVLKLEDKENCENWSPSPGAKAKVRLPLAQVSKSSMMSKSKMSAAPRKPSPSPRRSGIPPVAGKKAQSSKMTTLAQQEEVKMTQASKVPVSATEQEVKKTPSKLWERRVSNPLPALITQRKGSAQKLVGYEESPGSVDYPSDKENVAPGMEKPSAPPYLPSAPPLLTVREPFKQLFCLPSPHSEYNPVFEPAPYPSSEEDSLDVPKHLRRQVLTAENAFYRRQKSDLKKQWHMVVDTNCFLDDDSFTALKKLEGIRETRVIIPKIVIRELDFLKYKEEKKYRTRKALKWIEECMVKMSWWIHVQNSNETRPVGLTPPVSPSIIPYSAPLGPLSPTNDDHVLDCALLFERSVSDGRVVLLTNDTALKIKAMAEDMISENAASFCESLLTPYSERFLWAGSTPHGPTWSARSRASPLSSPLSRPNTSLTGSTSSKQRLQEDIRGLQIVL